jgi:Type IV secretion system pilin
MIETLAASATATKLVGKISEVIVNPLVVIMFTFALVLFLWGVRAYITGADNPEARAKGAQHILWGVIGMALMFMSFTIVRIVLDTFGLQDSETKKDIDNVLK